MSIYFATTNKKKLEELKYFLEMELVQLNVDVQEIQGTEEEVALDKLKKTSKLNENNITIIDDASLNIKGLKGFPGPYCKQFLELGLDTLDRIVEEFGREAIARCYIGVGVYKNGDMTYKLFEGLSKGIISKFTGEQKCFDDLFIPNGTNKPFSKLLPEEVKIYNYRGLAIQEAKDYIKSLVFYFNNTLNELSS